MPAPELVKACDEMGMMLMAESFDEWNKAKCANGYKLIFDEWVEKDLVNLVHHYRNNQMCIRDRCSVSLKTFPIGLLFYAQNL